MMAAGGMREEVDIFGHYEEITCTKSSTAEDKAFDEVIGHIQDIIMDDEFSLVQQSFMERNYSHFEDTEENKFIYTDIHREYIQVIEDLINKQLLARMPQFEMKKFMESLPTRRDQVPEEIFDILTSFTDFLAFKQMFLDYKADKEGTGVNLDGLLISHSTQSNR